MKQLKNNTRFLVLFLALALAPSLFAQQEDVWIGADISWYTSDTNADSFVISTPAELYGLAYIVTSEREIEGYRYEQFAGKTISLSNDINLSTPIDTAYGSVEHGTGTTYAENWTKIGWGYSATNTTALAELSTFPGNV